MSRTPLLAGNWKMHGARAEAIALAGALAKSAGKVRGREVVIAPPFTALEPVREAIAGTDIRLASPSGLDLSTQEGKNKLREELLKVLEGKYSKDYEELIRKYFDQLEKEDVNR